MSNFARYHICQVVSKCSTDGKSISYCTATLKKNFKEENFPSYEIAEYFIEAIAELNNGYNLSCAIFGAKVFAKYMK